MLFIAIYLSYVAVSRPGHLLQFIPNRPGLYTMVRIKGVISVFLVDSSHYTAVDHYIYSEYNYEIS